MCNDLARVLFCAHDGEMVAQHGIIKKTQKTSPDHPALALKPMMETTTSAAAEGQPTVEIILTRVLKA